MKRLSKDTLRSIVMKELKSMVDEDALHPTPKLGEPHYLDLDTTVCKVCGGDHKDSYHDEEDEAHGDDMPLFVYLSEACGCEGDPENLINTMGNFSNLNMTNITPDEAFHAGKAQHHKRSSYMAKPQLAKIAKYAKELHDMIGRNEQLDDWQESHIAQLADDIGEVYHSLDYKKNY
jgi:hypothetical protein